MQTGVGGEGGALNTLRNFRLQKKKFTPGSFDTDSSQEMSQNNDTGGATSANNSLELESPIRPAGYKKRVLADRITPEPPHSANGENGFSPSPKPPAHKRIRMISDSESENGGTSPAKNDNSFPSSDDIEQKVNFLRNACPGVDTMVLQDTLKLVILQ